MNGSTANGGVSLPAPALSFAQTSINANGTSVVHAPSLNGIPSGATVTYTSQQPNIATVNPTTGAITPKANGTATIVATTTATGEYAKGSASFKVVVSGIVTPTVTLSPTSVEFTTNGQNQKVTFANDSAANVTVAIKSGSGVTYSVASDKKSVTFSCADTSIAQNGSATITVGTASAVFSWTVSSGVEIG